MAEHTPGPWSICWQDADAILIEAETDNVLGPLDVACIDRDEHGADETPEQAANARLIAQAPKLLEACEALLMAFESWEMMAALDVNVQRQAHAAIAKAKGET